MAGIIIGVIIVCYTVFIIIKKTRDLKAGKTCCSGCSSCPSKGCCEGGRK